jgi:hypothetical protein
MNDSIIHSDLNKIGYTFLRYDKPYQFFKGPERTIGYCVSCGILIDEKNGYQERRRWKTRTLDELIAFANEGTVRV